MIISFPNQSLRKENTTATQNKPSVPPILTQVIHLEPKEMAQPTGVLQQGELSINAMLDQFKQAKKDTEKELPRNAIDFNDFISNWKTIAHRMRARDHEQVYLAMSKRDPEQISPEVFRFVLDNPIQFERLQAAIQIVNDELKTALENFYIKIELVLDTDTSNNENDSNYLTGQERFEKLANKNSNLHTLKSRFNLDIEY